jgi:hypothetical protein
VRRTRALCEVLGTRCQQCICRVPCCACARARGMVRLRAQGPMQGRLSHEIGRARVGVG